MPFRFVNNQIDILLLRVAINQDISYMYTQDTTNDYTQSL